MEKDIFNKHIGMATSLLSSIDEESVLCDYIIFNLPKRKDNLKVIDDSEVDYFNIVNIREV